MVRPVKAFDAILNAVVMELQCTRGAKVKLTLEIEADAEEGFSDADIGIIRDNAHQLKFKAGSTGFESLKMKPRAALIPLLRHRLCRLVTTPRAL
ncbi:MAG: hypothetical protein ACREE4_20655 [Stellaceae bacterium]